MKIATNQQTNKPTNQQTNKPTNQQTNKSTNQQINKSTNQQTQTQINEALQIVKRRKYMSNCFAFHNEISSWVEQKKANIFLINECVFLFLKANGFYKFYYFIQNFKDLFLAQNLLDEFRKKSDISLEFTTKNDKFIDEITNILHDIGFDFYAKFARLSDGVNKMAYLDNKSEAYELADFCDIDELLEIMHKNFDVIIDDIPTKDELEKLINEKTLIIKKIDNKIIYIQIYELSKKSLYSRLTWIHKSYRKPKYAIKLYNSIDTFLKDKNLQKLHAYYWINTSIKNYKIMIKQEAVLQNLTCTIFTYKKKKS